MKFFPLFCTIPRNVWHCDQLGNVMSLFQVNRTSLIRNTIGSVGQTELYIFLVFSMSINQCCVISTSLCLSLPDQKRQYSLLCTGSAKSYPHLQHRIMKTITYCNIVPTPTESRPLLTAVLNQPAESRPLLTAML